ncbi:hypothetical protein LP123_03830 [Moraxella bovis]|uniref:Uncharacterized protein n=2 Tax=Moraxella bovis TaxID=476 RepID=A0AAQ2Q7E6_MORBO|nr:hypothetical protein [Moraxella bovis]UYZ75166.1 hypothetical protein LP093_10415 [Moraxella bovis]UYZ78902.1 hypothetical protein LP115_03435 [Moraxella bovis]UYZ80511.1 hypothetical protein LP113_10780 [Moraxella bovis]UYZ87385.1 hypothetical protein LP094_03450 [Moraxella bovis]UYZ92811.1 hypothetical protein LP103_03425 [Moraxella bovis]
MKNFVGFVIFHDFFTIIQRASDYNNANYQHKRHTMTQKYDMTELWSKWTVLVWLNAILGLFLGGFLEIRLWTYNIGIFFGAFFLTVVTGGILSFVGAILTAVIMAIMIFGDYLKNNGDKR